MLKNKITCVIHQRKTGYRYIISWVSAVSQPWHPAGLEHADIILISSTLTFTINDSNCKRNSTKVRPKLAWLFVQPYSYVTPFWDLCSSESTLILHCSLNVIIVFFYKYNGYRDEVESSSSSSVSYKLSLVHCLRDTAWVVRGDPGWSGVGKFVASCSSLTPCPVPFPDERTCVQLYQRVRR